MPSVHSNTIFECSRCKAKVDLEDPSGVRAKGCPVCGHDKFLQIVVVCVCDFCSIPGDIFWTYPCNDFDYGIPESPRDGSTGDWAACDTCHELIQAGERKAVIRRAVDFELSQHPQHASIRHEIWGVISRIHNGFYDHRTGEPPFRETKEEYEKRKEDDERRAH